MRRSVRATMGIAGLAGVALAVAVVVRHGPDDPPGKDGAIEEVVGPSSTAQEVASSATIAQIVPAGTAVVQVGLEGPALFLEAGSGADPLVAALSAVADPERGIVYYSAVDGRGDNVIRARAGGITSTMSDGHDLVVDEVDGRVAFIRTSAAGAALIVRDVAGQEESWSAPSSGVLWARAFAGGIVVGEWEEPPSEPEGYPHLQTFVSRASGEPLLITGTSLAVNDDASAALVLQDGRLAVVDTRSGQVRATIALDAVTGVPEAIGFGRGRWMQGSILLATTDGLVTLAVDGTDLAVTGRVPLDEPDPENAYDVTIFDDAVVMSYLTRDMPTAPPPTPPTRFGPGEDPQSWTEEHMPMPPVKLHNFVCDLAATACRTDRTLDGIRVLGGER